VSSPAIETVIAAALEAGAWGGKACGAGGGGCVVVLSAPEKMPAVREALARLREGRLLLVAAENRGLTVRS
jgi:D-glycero-alpha-D-manno-heptose-7-phosphate kinase